MLQMSPVEGEPLVRRRGSPARGDRDGTVSSSTRVSLTMGLEKWSSASPMSMVRSELWVLVPEKNSGLVSKIERTAAKTKGPL